MSVIFEKSFQPRLLYAQKLLSYVKKIPHCCSNKRSEIIDAFSIFIHDIEQVSNYEIQLEQKYANAVKARQSAFEDNKNSLLKSLPLIRSDIKLQFGKHSYEYKETQWLIDKMEIIEHSEVLNVPDGSINSADATRRIAKSQQSYSALLGYFNDLIDLFISFENYKPSDTCLEIAELQSFGASLDLLNIDVAHQYLALYEQNRKHLELYSELNVRIHKVKAYLQAHYGPMAYQYAFMNGVAL